MAIKFDEFNYYPALRSRPAEVRGFKELSEEKKDSVLPIFTLGAWPRQIDTKTSLFEVINATGGRPFILDLTSEPIYITDDIRELKDCTQNFKKWQNFVKNIDNEVIPAIQITADSKISHIIRQARAFEDFGCGKLAFKIQSFGDEIKDVIAALSALDSSDNALVIIDTGYIRETMHASLAATVTTINEIRDEVDDAIISVISTSFPSSVMPFIDPSSKGQRGVISMLETKLHAAIGADAAIYGDHGSIHSRVYPTRGGKFVARIDYPLQDAWVFERRSDTNSQGYISAAEALLDAYPEIEDDESWGAVKISQAANGEIDNMKTPASWIAARVNMHITKQIETMVEGVVTDEEDFDDLI